MTATRHTPQFDTLPFPEWAVEVANRIQSIAAAVGEKFDHDEQDRYNGPQACGMILRPAATMGDRTVTWRLATVEEAKAWRDEHPDWWSRPCVCGHTYEQHRNEWGDDDTIVGQSCEECDCASSNGGSCPTVEHGPTSRLADEIQRLRAVINVAHEHLSTRWPDDLSADAIEHAINLLAAGTGGGIDRG